MDNNNPNYQKYISELDQIKNNQEIKHIVYLSRRAIWANVLLALLSWIFSYIHTRRWKTMGIFIICQVIFFVVTDEGLTMEENLKKGTRLAPLFSLIAIVDNGIAIKKARDKVNS